MALKFDPKFFQGRLQGSWKGVKLSKYSGLHGLKMGTVWIFPTKYEPHGGVTGRQPIPMANNH